MMKKDLEIQIRDYFAHVKKQNIGAHAASVAFFFFLSLVPLLILLCALIPYTPLTEEHLVTVLTDLTPDMVDPMVKGLIDEVYIRSGGILSFATIAVLWSAAKGVMALMRGLNAVYDVEEERNYFVIRGIASFYTLIMLLVMVLSLILVVFGNRLVELALYKIPTLEQMIDFLMNFRFVFVWVILTILFGMVYTYIPGIKLRFREQLLGAMFSAILWIVFSWGFSVYVDFGYAGSIYGSMTIIVLVMLWMYFCMYIILVGAYLNRYFKKP